jgi:hypothetical protein
MHIRPRFSGIMTYPPLSPAIMTKSKKKILRNNGSMARKQSNHTNISPIFDKVSSPLRNKNLNHNSFKNRNKCKLKNEQKEKVELVHIVTTLWNNHESRIHYNWMINLYNNREATKKVLLCTGEVLTWFVFFSSY